MATVKRKKGFAVNFNLSLPGMLGVGVVCFCIFLWMFLLGIWSGQTFLSTGKKLVGGAKTPQVKTLQTVAKKSTVSMEKAVSAPVTKEVVSSISKKNESQVDPENGVVSQNKPVTAAEDPAFFAVQVAAFKDATLAAREVKSWMTKGYKSFSRPPAGGGDVFTRVYVGHFDSMAAAKDKAADIAKKGKIKPFVVLVPARIE